MTEHAGVGIGLAIIPTDRLDILWAKITHPGQYSVVFAYVRVLHRQSREQNCLRLSRGYMALEKYWFS